MIPDDLAAIAVHLEGQHGVRQAGAIIVEEQQGIDEGVAQPILLVQGFIGIGHINALLEQLAGQVAPLLGTAGVAEHSLRGLSPRVTPPALEGLARDIVPGQYTEGRNNVLLKVLVLIIAPDQEEVRLEGVDCGPQLAKAGHQPLPMRHGGGEALILAELITHGLGPTAGVLLGRGDPLVVLQHARQAGPPALIRANQPWEVGHANAENVCHGNLHNTENRLRLSRSAQPLWHIIELRAILPKLAMQTMIVHAFPLPRRRGHVKLCPLRRRRRGERALRPCADTVAPEGARRFQELEQAGDGDPRPPRSGVERLTEIGNHSCQQEILE